MQRIRRHLLGLALLSSLTPLLGMGTAQAQTDWPKRTIKVVVPYPAGGATDNNLGFYSLDRIQLELRENGAPACLTSTDLPQAVPSLACFTVNKSIELTFLDNRGRIGPNRIIFTMTALDEVPEPTTLGELIAELGAGDERLAAVLAVCTVLVEGRPASAADVLPNGAVKLDVLPPFAGG